MDGACHCQCHHVLRGEQRSAAHAGRLMTAFEFAQQASVWEYKHGCVSARDPIEAAMASGCWCLDNHVAALSGPANDRRHRYAIPQADGYTDGYEEPAK